MTNKRKAPGAATPEASDVDQTTTKGDTMNSTTKAQTSNVQHTALPVIAGHEIAMDEHGRFNLNAIHHAADSLPHKRPSQWARRDEAQELIAALSQSADLHFDPIKSVRGGAHKGTFAHELLAVSYAGWISPRFQLQVNQVFLDYRMGKLEAKAAIPALPSPLTPRHQRELQKAIAGRVYAEVPEQHRPAAFKRVYRHLKDRFDVAKYDQIDDNRYTEALGAVQSFTIEGELLERHKKEEELSIDFPLSSWPDINPEIANDFENQWRQDHYIVLAKHFMGAAAKSPTLMVLNVLERAGYDVGACRHEVKFMKHFLELHTAKLESIMNLADTRGSCLRVTPTH